jgi:hypothetical protein
MSTTIAQARHAMDKRLNSQSQGQGSNGTSACESGWPGSTV